jgi:hypothetical protein
MHRRIASCRIRPSWKSPHQALYAPDGREDCAGGKQRTVAEAAKDGVFGPFGVFEAFVRCAGRQGLAAEQMSQRPRPQTDTLFPKLELRARDWSRIGHKLGCQLKEGLTDLGRIAHVDIGHVLSVYEDSLKCSLAFGNQRLKSFHQSSGIRSRNHFAVSHGSNFLSRSSCGGRRSICGLLATSCSARTGMLPARALMTDIPHPKLFYKNPIDIHGTAATIRVPIKSAIM